MASNAELMCSICGRERVNNRGWRVCRDCLDVQLDVENGRVSARSPRWYCGSCVKVLEFRRFLWFKRTPLCGHCGEELPA